MPTSQPRRSQRSEHAVIVLGVDSPIGLTLVRECGVHGLCVVGLGSTINALGLESRFVSAKYTRERDPTALTQQINTLANRHQALALLTVSETDIELLNRVRKDLDPRLLLLIPSPDIMAKVIDKKRCLEIAETVGIETPRTVTLSSIDELEARIAGLRFPVVLKWANPHAVAATLAEASLKLHKVEYASDASKLRAVLARYAQIGIFPLIQEYCPGHGMGQMFLMRDGADVLRFQHRRIHEFPPEGGTSSLCQSISSSEHRDCQERSLALLRALNWEGPAMVEYRHDPSTGRYVLMEVNGRFWGSQPLAFHAGAHFAWATIASALGWPIGSSGYRDGLRCRYMVPETYRLLQILCRGNNSDLRNLKFSKMKELASYLLGFVDPRMRYYVYWTKDPRPCLADLWAISRKGLRRFYSRKDPV